MKTVLLIPTLNPSDKLIYLVNDLQKLSFDKIIIINDGSSSKYNKYFKEVEKLNCLVLTHKENLGKGEALRTGFKYIKENYFNIDGVITLDSDGQHTAEDVLKIAKELEINTDNLILGVRNILGENVPKRSKFGNKFSIKYFRLITGKKCSDTQTGLRGIPFKYLDFALEIEGSRYDYEMNFLIKATKKMKFIEIPIDTIYENNNDGSHFKTFSDSYLIYKEPITFGLVSLSSAIIDVGLFALLTINNNEYYYIMLATIIARIASGMYSFVINKKMIFKSKNNFYKEFFKYTMLFVLTMLASSFIVASLSFININVTIIKMIIDSFLAIISYFIQKKYIFKY